MFYCSKFFQNDFFFLSFDTNNVLGIAKKNVALLSLYQKLKMKIFGPNVFCFKYPESRSCKLKWKLEKNMHESSQFYLSGQFFIGKVHFVGSVNVLLTYLIYGLSICYLHQDNTGKKSSIIPEICYQIIKYLIFYGPPISPTYISRPEFKSHIM